MIDNFLLLKTGIQFEMILTMMNYEFDDNDIFDILYNINELKTLDELLDYTESFKKSNSFLKNLLNKHHITVNKTISEPSRWMLDIL